VFQIREHKFLQEQLRRTDLSEADKHKLLLEDPKLNNHLSAIAQELTAGDITAFLCFCLNQMHVTASKIKIQSKSSLKANNEIQKPLSYIVASRERSLSNFGQ
jgi:hypothetical protein